MFKGVFSPIVTIFKKNGEIDFQGCEVMIESIIKEGIDGILFLGSMGEFHTLSQDEKKKFVDFAVKAVNGRVSVLVGTGGTCVDDVLDFTRYVEKKGADGAVVVSPYYFKLDDESIYRYYKEVAECVEMPIIIYNFPDRTSVNLDPELVLRLAKDFKNIAGIKDTVDSISHTRKLIETVKSEIDNFSVFSGFDEYMLPNLIIGGDGLIGGLTNIAPGLFANISRAFKEGDLKTAVSLQRKVDKLMELYDISQPFIASIKMAAYLTGREISTLCRKPSGTLNDEQILQIESVLKKTGLK